MTPRDIRDTWRKGEVRVFRWLRHGEPLPDGAEPADSAVIDSNHKHYARLIRLKGEE